jgi:hypothetical protein
MFDLPTNDVARCFADHLAGVPFLHHSRMRIPRRPDLPTKPAGTLIDDQDAIDQDHDGNPPLVAQCAARSGFFARRLKETA